MCTFHPFHRAMLIFYPLTGLGVTVDAQARIAPAQAKATTDWQKTSGGTWQRIANAKGTMESSPEEGWQPLGSTPTSPSKSVQVRLGVTTEIPNDRRPPEISRSSMTPVSPSMSAADAFVLAGGKFTQAQLEAWTARAGQTMEWNVSDDWIVPNDRPLGNDFTRVAQQTIEQLAANGADAQADVWKDSQVIAVHQAGVGE